MTADLLADPYVLSAAALLAGGALAAGFANRVRLPALLLFLVVGMLIGDDGLGLLSFDEPEFAQAMAVVALLVILFQGGLATKPSDLRRAALPGVALATLGVVVTAVVIAGAVHLALGLELITSLLIGSVVASTDAAAVFTVLRRSPLPKRLVSLLEVESGSNDPMAIVLTIGVLETWRAQPTVGEWALFGLLQLGGGLLVGAAFGIGGAWLLRRAELGASSLYPVLALAGGGLAYGLAAWVDASGFLAVYVTGLIIGALVPRRRRDIRNFFDGLSSTAEIGLFLMLGLLVFPADLPTVALPALIVTAVMVFLARPAAVAVCLPWGGYGLRELTLVAWCGLRGAVPIVLATFPLTARYPEGEFIFNIVFFVVLISVAVQGSTLAWTAGRLGLRQRASRWEPVAEALPLEGVEADLVEVDITDDLHVAGRSLRDQPLPAGALLVLVLRADQAIVPTGDTRLLPGDLALIAVNRRPTATEEVVAWARGELDGWVDDDAASTRGRS